MRPNLIYFPHKWEIKEELNQQLLRF